MMGDQVQTLMGPGAGPLPAPSPAPADGHNLQSNGDPAGPGYVLPPVTTDGGGTPRDKEGKPVPSTIAPGSPRPTKISNPNDPNAPKGGQGQSSAAASGGNSGGGDRSDQPGEGSGSSDGGEQGGEENKVDPNATKPNDTTPNPFSSKAKKIWASLTGKGEQK